MYFVYILQSEIDGSSYVGSTTDVEKRLKEHNSGSSQYTSGKKPFVLKWYCAFITKSHAENFERYLKHGSGHAFARKHLLPKSE